MLQCCHIVFSLEILDQNRPVCWSIVMKIKPTVGSPYFGAFLSDRIPKATKDVNVLSFTHVVISCKLYQLIPVNHLTPNDPYRGRTAPLTSKVAFYIFIRQI